MLKLSVIVPVYNEENTVGEILDRLGAEKIVNEVVVVDDGSTDGTVAVLKRNRSNKFKIFQQRHQGKGGAVRLGLSKIKGNYVIIQDADLEYDPSEIKKLVAHLSRPGVNVVYGTRFLGAHTNLLFWHRVGNFILNTMVNLLYDSTLSDMETCYKLIPTKLAKELDLQSNGFELEPEITCKLLKNKIRIFETPITYVGRGFEEGKKITWRDGIKAFWIIIKLRFSV